MAQDDQWVSDWIRANARHECTEDELRCLMVLTSIGAIYNIPLIQGGWRGLPDGAEDYDHDDAEVLPAVEWGGNHVLVRTWSSLSTYDTDSLTRLVLAGHRHAVRVDLSAGSHLSIDFDADASRWDPDVDRPERYQTEGDPDYPNQKGWWVTTDKHPTYVGHHLTIMLHARQREGRLMERHPDMEQAVAAIEARLRKYDRP